MTLMLNGKQRDVPCEANLSNLLVSLQLAEKLVLVELNGNPVERANFAVTKLGEGDTVEIVRMVGGG
jgi:sulfur carrier protein